VKPATNRLSYGAALETQTNPRKIKSVVHSLALNNDIVYEGTGFDIIYV
jgi:hypothetical protein